MEDIIMAQVTPMQKLDALEPQITADCEITQIYKKKFSQPAA